MHREGPSSIFTIYFNGQFWVGTIERIEGSELSAAHVVFGAEPSNERALQFVIEKWGELRFSPEVKTERKKGSSSAGNAKPRLLPRKRCPVQRRNRPSPRYANRIKRQRKRKAQP